MTGRAETRQVEVGIADLQAARDSVNPGLSPPAKQSFCWRLCLSLIRDGLVAIFGN
jgi:hypothetical protein